MSRTLDHLFVHSVLTGRQKETNRLYKFPNEVVMATTPLQAMPRSKNDGGAHRNELALSWSHTVGRPEDGEEALETVAVEPRSCWSPS